MLNTNVNLQVRSCRRPLVSICDGTGPEVVVDIMLKSVTMKLLQMKIGIEIDDQDSDENETDDDDGVQECRSELETVCSTTTVEQSPGVNRPDTRYCMTMTMAMTMTMIIVVGLMGWLEKM